VFYLLLIALAITGEVLPEDYNRFYVVAGGQKPMVVLREDNRFWNAKIMDPQNLNYIHQGQYHLNGLAIGHKTNEGFDYYDMSEILSIETTIDLAQGETFNVQEGTIYVEHNDNFNENLKEIKLLYSPKKLGARDYSVSILWEKHSSSGMILSASEHRKLTESDIKGFSERDLNVARNEIFARHGYTFNSDKLTYLFSQTSWYKPRTKNVTLTSIEHYNVAFLKQHEQAAKAARSAKQLFQSEKREEPATNKKEQAESDVPCTCAFNKNRSWNPEKIEWNDAFWQCANYRDDGTCSKVSKVNVVIE